MSLDLKGTGVAIVTPFKKDKSVDLDALGRLIEHIVTGGVEYIVVLGTTGESVTLTAEEKNLVVNKVKEVNANRLPIILGIGGNNTASVVDQLRSADLGGISGILSVSPYYNKPTQEGIYQHYKAISLASPLPVILYNVPPRTGSNVTAETVLRIAHEFPNIVAVKEASGDMAQSMAIIKGKPKGFFVLSGEDLLTLPLIASGADGVISVVANAFPREFSDMVRQTASGDMESARKNHYLLHDITKQMFAEGNPGGVKATLKVLGVTGDDLRLPLVNVSDALFQTIEGTVSAIKKA